MIEKENEEKIKQNKFYCEFDSKFYNRIQMVKLLKINVDMFNYYFNKLSLELQNEVIKSNDYKYKYLYRIISNKIIYCIYSNKLIPFERVLRGCITFSDVESLWGKGISTRNKKRPEHAKIISLKLKGVKKSNEHRNKMTQRLKSIDFKKKVLSNKGIEYTDDSSVYEKYAALYSNLLKSFDFKKSFVLNNYKLYLEDTELTHEEINQMSETEILNLYSELMSIKSSIAMANSTSMGNAKIVKIENLQYNLRNINSIDVRSEMEKKIISFFERNKIYWDYETEIIKYFFNFNRRYIMDFIFYIDGKCNYMEVKGSVRSSDVEKTLAKTKTAIEKFGEIYVYQKELITSIKDLDKIKYNNFSEFKLKHVYGD